MNFTEIVKINNSIMSLYESNNLLNLRDNQDNNNKTNIIQLINLNKFLSASNTEKLRTIFKSKLETNCKEITITNKKHLIPDNSNSIDINPSELSQEEEISDNIGFSDKKSRSNREKRAIKLSNLDESNI